MKQSNLEIMFCLGVTRSPLQEFILLFLRIQEGLLWVNYKKIPDYMLRRVLPVSPSPRYGESGICTLSLGKSREKSPEAEKDSPVKAKAKS